MKKFLFVIILILIMISCTNLEEGKSGASNTIKESKKIGVFYSEKKVTECSTYDSLGNKLKIDSFWFEKMWDKGNSSDKVNESKELYQFIANLYYSIPDDIVDSIYVIYNNNSSVELGIFDSQIRANYFKKYELPDSVVLDFYIRRKNSIIKLKTCYLQ